MREGTGRNRYQVSMVASVGNDAYMRKYDEMDVPLALDRLDDDGGSILGCGLLAEEQVELVLGLTDDFLFGGGLRDTERVPVRVGGGEHAGLLVS